MDAQTAHTPTIGSLFAGIGGFDLGFEQAGFTTAWQVEIKPECRAVLADHFPHARQFADVRTALPNLWRVDVICGGFPCQDVSTMGRRAGLGGKRTGLFFDAMHIVNTLKPRWLVLENVPRPALIKRWPRLRDGHCDARRMRVFGILANA